jgi:amidase
MAPQLAGAYSSEKKNQFTASQIAATNVEQREIKKAYLEYWNSTASETGTGRPIDAIISPLAPFPAARPKLYAYYGYTTWVNLLDYTSVVVPITTVDKALDPKDADYKPLNPEDKVCAESCKCCSKYIRIRNK